MKKLSKIYVWILVPLLLGLNSCSDYFSPDIPTLLPEEEAYKDFLSSRAAVNGLYTGMQDLMTGYVVLGELRGDMIYTGTSANQDLKDIYQVSIKSDNAYLPYRNAFSLIHSSNQVIQNLANLRSAGTTYDEELDNMYAEALLLRTWIYFYLYRNYEEVPYIIEAYDIEATGTDIVEWIESQTEEMVSLPILEDQILTAIPLFDTEKTTETSFFNLTSAYGLLGEIYLWENSYADAVDVLLSSIKTGEGNRFILDRDLENSKWLNIFKGDETANDEIITKIIFDKGEKQQNGLFQLFAGQAVNGNQLAPVKRIEDYFRGTHRFEGTFKGGFFVGKYTRSTDDPYTSDMPIILYRAADLHLMLAEAYNRLGDYDTALDLLNNGSDSLFTAGSKGIRGRVALPGVSLNVDEDAKMIELEDLILFERGLELAFEGKRWYDILRIGKRRNNTDYIANAIMQRFENPDSSAIRNYFADPSNWYLPHE